MSHVSYKQPKQLIPLFFTELWERFGYYVTQTILILYLSNQLNYTDKHAYLLYSTFGAMMYLTPCVGGYLADRYLGLRRCVLLGGACLTVGYGILAIPSPNALFLGLSILIIGNGFFKPNISSMVGRLYEIDDPRRDGGFTIFYMGINIGSILPPIFIGTIVALYTWGSGFALASLGMVISLITFFSSKSLKEYDPLPKKSPLKKNKHFKVYSSIAFASIIAIIIFQVFFYYPEQANIFLISSSLAIMGTILAFIFKEKPKQRRKLWACLILITLSIGFWAVYIQTYSSLMLFTSRNIDREIFGWPVHTEFLQFFNPFFIIALSPILNRMWTYLNHKGLNPSTPTKFSFGILCISIGFFVLWLGSSQYNTNGIASIWWLVLSYFIQTLGELLLSPIGLSMVTRLAPPHLVSTMMGVWFLTLSASFAIGGFLSTLADIPSGATIIESLAIYEHAFVTYALITAALAIMSFSLIPYLKKLIAIPSTPIQTPKS